MAISEAFEYPVVERFFKAFTSFTASSLLPDAT